ncbi:hypothetical protein [Adlercreutzia sp. ZJ141]|uniref:hypothetical protein n=1 Tax=Adlercreutzia sp. ZJ141 TaxID=2709406 RepID=UPI0013ED4DA9|nr:hypothetical protein [Adlercreutzia sp. ZJ141]
MKRFVLLFLTILVAIGFYGCAFTADKSLYENNVINSAQYLLEGKTPGKFISDELHFNTIADGVYYSDVHVKSHTVDAVKDQTSIFDKEYKYVIGGNVTFTGSFNYYTNGEFGSNDYEEVRTYGPYEYHAWCTVTADGKVNWTGFQMNDL